MRRLAYLLGAILAVGAIATALWPDPWAAADRRAVADTARLAALIDQPDRIGWCLSEDPAIARAVLWDDKGDRRYPPTEQFTPVPYKIGEDLDRELSQLRVGLTQPQWFRLDATGRTQFHCRPAPAICVEYLRPQLEAALSMPPGQLLDDPTGPWRAVILALASLAALAVAIWPQTKPTPTEAVFHLHPDRHCATRGTLEIALTPRDLKLLILLQARAGAVVTKD